MAKQWRPAEFQRIDLEVVKLQIKKVRYPNRWTLQAENKLKEKIERRAYYEQSSFSDPQDDSLIRDFVAFFCVFMIITFVFVVFA